MANIMDNLERIGNAGASRDVTGHPVYDAGQTVGPSSDFSRDFLQGTDTVQSTLLEADASDLAPAPEKTADIRNVGGFAAQAVVTTPAPMFTVAQGGVGTVATQITYPNPNRLALTLLNQDATNTLFVGPNSAVTVDSGFPVPPGSSLTIAVTAGIYAVAAADVAVAVMEYTTGD